MTALAALLGAVVGLGLMLVVVGARGRELRAPHRSALGVGWQRRAARLGVALGAGVAVGAVTRWPVGALLAVVAAMAVPGYMTGEKAHATLVGRVEAVATWAEMLRDTMAGAAGIAQAIAATAPIAPEPIRPSVLRLSSNLGRQRTGDALRSFGDEVADPTCDLVVAALTMAAEHHGNRLGELLGALARAARDHATMYLRVEASRARTRTSIRVILGATTALAVLLILVNRAYLAPYDSSEGQAVLLLIGGLFASAFAWLVRMARPQRPERFLVHGKTTS